MIHKIFKSKSVYIRPSTNLSLTFDGTDSEDSSMEADAPSATTGHSIASQMSYHMNTRARGYQTSLIQVSNYPCTRRPRTNQLSAAQPESTDSLTTANQFSSAQGNDVPAL
ncbi:hypothetical protein XENOCAPTIV_000526 [Xenoophorus captivus]|uniref:Uncharacterized protein n=1 Tax=Xenoophorus captivus TaxID=1517983 RepID=A0ABV0Q827_9TELE